MILALRIAWLEAKLLLREPVTTVFTLALPAMMLLVMGGVFGNQAEAGFYRGVGAMDYYLPAYAGLVCAALGVIALPTHLAAYRERGVLRRLEASAIPRAAHIGAQVIVMVALSVVGAAIVIGLGAVAYDVHAPVNPALFALGLLFVAVTFGVLGVLLGVVMPTARAAQGAGILTWFVMLILGGAGPPPEVLPGAMGAIGAATPLKHGIELLQAPWLGFAWDWGATAVIAGFLVASLILSAATMRLRSAG